MPRPTPFRLEDIRIASPCTERWGDMTGDERSRFCGRCEKNVYDISAMTRTDAEEFLGRRIGESTETCVRFARRRDGTIVTNDCGIGSRPTKKALRVLTAFGAAAAAVLSACGEGGDVDPAVMGGVARGMNPKPADSGVAKLGDTSARDDDDQPLMGRVAARPLDEEVVLMGEMVAPPSEAR